ncbi:tetratricopeptide repeat protein [Winogradskyella aurantiaca]|uniref:tetratricopeptide repeat protein n=1 Tax=Winogradskyella aurantiaca TaxID=2219558 RepID=UPI000E1DA52B|nr:tetratricopeptide repeat protein [Winogradskyella aurantiaca]
MSRESRIHDYLTKAWQLRSTGDATSSKSTTDKAYELCRSDDNEFLGRIFHIYRQLEADTDNYDEALAHNIQSLTYYKASGNIDRIAHSMRHLADLQAQLKNYKEATKNYTSAIQLYEDNSNTCEKDLSNALISYAELLDLIGKKKETINQWTKALDLYQKIGFKEGMKLAEHKLTQLLKS